MPFFFDFSFKIQKSKGKIMRFFPIKKKLQVKYSIFILSK